MIIDGKTITENIKNDIKKEIIENNYKPTLSIIMAGNDESSRIYAKAKIKACKSVGINTEFYHFEDNEEDKFVAKLNELNLDNNVSGIMLEMPLPKSYKINSIIDIINPIKDVDAISPYNMGRLFTGNPLYIPCTPKAIHYILKSLNIDFTGKHAVVVGRSNIVGKPVAHLLLSMNMTITICHSKTINLKEYTKQADVLVLAVGKRNLLNKEMIKKNVVLIDAGINYYDGKIFGDADFEDVKEDCSYITPVPGGVGPITTTMILLNTLEAYKNAIKSHNGERNK